MKKLLIVAVVLAGLPIAVTTMIVMSLAATHCTPPPAPGAVAGRSPGESPSGSSGEVDGPVGGPVRGELTMAQANIPNRVGLRRLRASMPSVLSRDPDFVTLNEVSGRSLAQLEDAAPGYAAWRERASTGDANSMGNVVLWKRDVWTRVAAGRVQLVDDDRLFFKGRPRTSDRFATWVMLQRSDGAVVSVVATHHMTNPHKFPRQHGNPGQTRAEQYGAGMDRLMELTGSLETHGPVLVGGDMNTHASPAYARLGWSAVSKMRAAGYAWANHSVDYVFYPRSRGVRLAGSWTGTMRSDHQWVAARLDMNGAGPRGSGTAESALATVALPGSLVTAAPTATAPEEALAKLMAVRLSAREGTLTAEQAGNAIAIAQVARELKVPRAGLEVAFATAIQESRLVNLDRGDRDSLGLFQQRPSQGWGRSDQIRDRILATRAYFGRAEHTSNRGLLDVPGWEQMALTEAAQAVQGSGFPGAYAQWAGVAGEITDILGGDLPGISDVDVDIAFSAECLDGGDTVAPVTLGTLNLLGAGHTNGNGGGMKGFGGWQTRLAGAMSAIEDAGITVAALQEVHGPQADALASRYSQQWGMYPSSGPTQNKVIWNRAEWSAGARRLVDIPYFGGENVGMPLVQLTSTTTGQTIWVWSIHNPASTRGNAAGHRAEALRRQLDTLTGLTTSGAPAVIMGDFNDGGDGQRASHCVLSPMLSNAFGGSSAPCRPPKKGARIDHIYGANLTWASARVEHSTQLQGISDHPLVVATTAGSSAGCSPNSIATDADYNLGRVKPQLTQLVNNLAPRFGIKTVGGYRTSARDPGGHPSGLAADFMVPLDAVGKTQGDRLADYAVKQASELGIDYIIWHQRIWSSTRAREGWRAMGDRGDATQNHLDHVHINVKPAAPAQASSAAQGDTRPSGPAGCAGQVGDVIYPVDQTTDRRNYGAAGASWARGHTGTDFSVACGTSVVAAHAGRVQIDTAQSWSGRWLVKVRSGPGQLTTWYAHMQAVAVSRGEAVQPGQKIGEVGSEGNSRGCHLHFEVHPTDGGIYEDGIDPSAWLAASVAA